MFHRFGALARHSAAYSLGSIVAKATAFLIIPLYTRFMIKDDYAAYVLLNAGGAVLGVLFELGVSSAVMRFYYDFDREHDRRRYIGTIWLFALLVTMVISLTLTLVGRTPFDQLFKGITFWPYGVLTIWSVFLGSANFIPWVLMRVREQSSRFLVLVAAQASALVVLAIVLVVVMRLGLLGAVLASFIQSCLVFVFFTVYTLRNASLRPVWSHVRPFLAYGLPVLVLQAGWWVLDASDRFILRRFTTLAIVAVYSVGYAIGRILITVSQSINQALTPFFFNAVTEGDPEAKDMASYAATYFLLAIGTLGLVVIVFAHEAVLFFGGHAYLEATDIVPLIVLGAIAQGMFYVPSRAMFLNKKMASFPLILLVGSVVNIGLNFALIPAVGMIGAAVATIAGYVATATLTFVISQRHYPIAYQWSRMARIVAVLVAEAVAQDLYTPHVWYAVAAWKAGLLLAAPAVLVASGFFEAGEWEALRTMIARDRGRRSGAAGPAKAGRAHAGVTFACSQCAATFVTDADLRAHAVRHDQAAATPAPALKLVRAPVEPAAPPGMSHRDANGGAQVLPFGRRYREFWEQERLAAERVAGSRSEA